MRWLIIIAAVLLCSTAAGQKWASDVPGAKYCGDVKQYHENGLYILNTLTYDQTGSYLIHNLLVMNPDGTYQLSVVPAQPDSALNTSLNDGSLLIRKHDFFVSGSQPGVDTCTIHIYAINPFDTLIPIKIPGAIAVMDMVNNPDSNIAVLSTNSINDTLNNFTVSKYDTGFNLVWTTNIDSAEYIFHGNKPEIITTADNGYIIIATKMDNTQAGNPKQTELTKLDENGQILWRKTVYTNNGAHLINGGVLELDNNNLLVTATALDMANNPNGYVTIGLRSNGDTIWTNHYKEYSVLPANNLVHTTTEKIVSIKLLNTGVQTPYYLFEIDQSGQVQDTIPIAVSPDYTQLQPACAIPTVDGGVSFIASSDTQVHQVKLDIKFNELNYTIVGSVYTDDSANCIIDSNVIGFSRLIVKAKNLITDEEYHTATDSLGNFTFEGIKPDSHIVFLTDVNQHWVRVCTGLHATFDTFNVVDTINIELTPLRSCSRLTAEISTYGLTPCDSGTYYIHYCNTGTDTALGGEIHVTLSPYFQIDTATIPWDSVVGNTLYRFPLGDVPPGECGTFQINGYVECDTPFLNDRTLCAIAHAFPDKYCLPGDTFIGGGALFIKIICEDGLAKVLMINSGDSPIGPLTLRVIEDEIIVYDLDTVSIDPFSFDTFTWTYTGKTIRVILEREDVIAGSYITGYPSATLEGCGDEASSVAGAINAFGQLDWMPYYDIDCYEIGYDTAGNNKIGIPVGIGEPHYITKYDDIEYTIRFRNDFGSTANKLIITDTLDSDLDPGQVRPGVSSHPYIYNQTNVALSFVFNNINLQPGSTGFVKFTVLQKQSLPPGTEFHNQATIQFQQFSDTTNTTLHTLGEIFVDFWDSTPIRSIYDPLITSIKVYPNPFNDILFIKTESERQIHEYTTMLYDYTGRLVQTDNFQSGSGELFINTSDLDNSLYILHIYGDGRLIGATKLIRSYGR